MWGFIRHGLVSNTSMLACLAIAVGACVAQEQAAEVKPSAGMHSAVIAFEVKPKELLAHPLGKLAFKDANDELQRLLKANRIEGFFALPSDPLSLQNMSYDQRIPLEFAMTVEFASKSDRLSALNDDVLSNLERVSSKGKTYYTVPSDESNLAMIVGDITVEIGTSNFLFRKHRELMTPRLTEAFDGISPAPVRIAIDITGASDFLNALVGIARKQKPPAWAIPLLDLPKKIEIATLSIDPNASELASFTGRSANPNDAKFISNMLDALVGLSQLKLREVKKTPPLANLLLKATKIATKDSTTTLTVSKPDNLDQAVSQSR